METKIPPRLIKPRFLREVPRSKYMPGPKLKSNEEEDRRSFISLLRKGPSKEHTQASELPVSITLNCAIWISLNKPVSSTVSLLLHCKEVDEEYCLLVDEACQQESDSIMLSGSATLYPKKPIEYIKLCYAGIGKEYHLLIDELHIDSEIELKDSAKLNVAN